MPEEKNTQMEENFSKKKVGGKKTVRKKTTEIKVTKVKEEAMVQPKKVVKKVVKRKPLSPTAKTINNKELNERLTSIYRDNDGKIPNMREIKVKKGHPVIRGFFTLLIVAGLMAITAWAGFFYLPGNKNKNDQQIDFYMEGPTRTDVGATTTYRIIFKNKEDLTMKNTVITVNYPENFVFSESSIEADNPGHTEWLIGDIGPKKNGELAITGLNYGDPEKESSWRIFINYTPENFNSEMQEVYTLKSVMNRPKIEFSLSGPEKVLLGDDAEYKIKVNYPNDLAVGNLKVTPKFPENFTITSSSPKMEKDNYWLISKLSGQENNEQELTVIGRYGEINDAIELPEAEVTTVISLPFNDQDFSLSEKYITTALAQNTYSANMAINGSMTDVNSRPGEMLNITAQFKNTGEDPMNDAVIKINLDSPSLNNRSCLDWASIDQESIGGLTGTQITENIRRGQVTWTKKEIPELEELNPGQIAEVNLQIPIQDTDKFDMSSLKEHIVTASMEVAFSDKSGKQKEISGNTIKIVLNSDLTLDTRNRQIAEGGVEKRQITWVLNNTFHPLKNVRLTAEIFGNGEFVAPEEVPAGEINYNETNKKVTWTINEMPLELETAALSFDIVLGEADPTQKAIMSKTSLSAEDTVTGETIYLAGEEIGI